MTGSPSMQELVLMLEHIVASEWADIVVVPEYVREAMRTRHHWPFPEVWPSITYRQLFHALSASDEPSAVPSIRALWAVRNEIRSSLDPSVTMQKVTLNNLVQWLEVIDAALLAPPKPSDAQWPPLDNALVDRLHAMTRDELLEWISARYRDKAPPDANLPPWKCFHCGEVFTTVGAAADHFGTVDGVTPGCTIDRVAVETGGTPERGRGLLMALRKAEAEVERWRRAAEDADYAASAEAAKRRQDERRIADACRAGWTVERLIEHVHGNDPAHGGLAAYCDRWPCTALAKPHAFTPPAADQIGRGADARSCIVCGWPPWSVAHPADPLIGCTDQEPPQGGSQPSTPTTDDTES